MGNFLKCAINAQYSISVNVANKHRLLLIYRI